MWGEGIPIISWSLTFPLEKAKLNHYTSSGCRGLRALSRAGKCVFVCESGSECATVSQVSISERYAFVWKDKLSGKQTQHVNVSQHSAVNKLFFNKHFRTAVQTAHWAHDRSPEYPWMQMPSIWMSGFAVPESWPDSQARRPLSSAQGWNCASKPEDPSTPTEAKFSRGIWLWCDCRFLAL